MTELQRSDIQYSGNQHKKAMTYRLMLFVKVEDLPEEHVDKDTEVVGVEIFCTAFRREQEVQDLEHEQLHDQVFRGPS